ncbi:MAG: hypothetical protein ACUVRK_11030 [Spirochaetota bacterium]
MINRINDTTTNTQGVLQKTKEMGKNTVEETRKRLSEVPKTLEEENKGKIINTQASFTHTMIKGAAVMATPFINNFFHDCAANLL